MSYTQSLEQLKELRLHGMASALDGILTAKQSSRMSSEQMLELLIQYEVDSRQSRKVDRLTKQARFRYSASIEQIPASVKQNIESTRLAMLSTCKWIDEGENILITGPTGVGKSHLASALGAQACMLGYSTLYFNAQKLFYNLRLSKMEGTHRKLIASIAKADLLIVDDFGLQKLEDLQRLDLMEIIEDRHGLKSTLIASQLPVAAWYEVIGEPTISDAILDRITHQSIRIELIGESLRKKK
jgi:DNA replication protein DnaC